MLRNLSVQNCRISDIGARIISQDLRALHSLNISTNSDYAGQNNVSEEGIIMLSEKLQALTTLHL